ncbi:MULTISPECIES: 3-hydroxyacyl-CoA dehydrogenase NAD-binding domain-containing protein [Catenuloplanes]|uniref:3-hydroxybutyryl-CoA dehydrogenase n=1 Tax=Catenuloplanes niger TaxID=587534 RepID=A0AAE4CUR5_9ACTN|nr:3-hydroxyacyl-CoA dehydrogenase NAD-binding domain-containing protein [Catenuloplanes niger]MDR7324687.1 3-hydroxybutyryl-CoA dehydrogenase [Catenuloplanes niger]
MNTIGVVGLGTMGAGIVEVFARNGLDVVAVEIGEAALERGRGILTGSTDRAVARGKLAPADRDALLGRVRFEVGTDALRDADLVIEAVPERLDLKRSVFAELDRVCKPSAVLATNTSSLPVTEIAVGTVRPDRVIGMHFFNPAPVMKLVEVVRTVVTADDVVADVAALCTRLGKRGVVIGDRAGFIANALLFGYLNHAVTLYGNGYVSRADLDTAMRVGCGLPMGPLALLDLIGLDVAAEILDTMYRRGGRDRRHAPAPLITQLVTAGFLGRKSGRGFYTYEQPGSAKVRADDAGPDPDGDAAAVRTIGVVGAGAPAAGLVEAFATAGFAVVAVAGHDAGDADRAEPPTSLPAEGPVADGPAADGRGRVTVASGLDRLAEVDLVVEAVDGDLAAKKALLAELDAVCGPGTVLVTTVSSLPVLEIAMATRRPADVAGLHLTGPELAELVHTIRTSPGTRATVRAVLRRLGRTVVSSPDRAGLVVRALLFPYLNDAVRMLEAGYSTAADIDAAMTLGCGYPAGPFEMLDAIGPDTVLATLRALYRESREPGLAPAPLLERMVVAGRGFRTVN